MSSDVSMSPNDQSVVLVVDFGAQYAQLIARRVREAHVYSEIVSRKITAKEIKDRNVAAIILSGGPKSVHEENAPILDLEIYSLGIPILGICYGAQLIVKQLGGLVEKTGVGEYGRSAIEIIPGTSTLLGAIEREHDVWMSHFDSITKAPQGFSVTASTKQAVCLHGQIAQLLLTQLKLYETKLEIAKLYVRFLAV